MHKALNYWIRSINNDAVWNKFILSLQQHTTENPDKRFVYEHVILCLDCFSRAQLCKYALRELSKERAT